MRRHAVGLMRAWFFFVVCSDENADESCRRDATVASRGAEVGSLSPARNGLNGNATTTSSGFHGGGSMYSGVGGVSGSGDVQAGRKPQASPASSPSSLHDRLAMHLAKMEYFTGRARHGPGAPKMQA